MKNDIRNKNGITESVNLQTELLTTAENQEKSLQKAAVQNRTDETGQAVHMDGLVEEGGFPGSGMIYEQEFTEKDLGIQWDTSVHEMQIYEKNLEADEETKVSKSEQIKAFHKREIMELEAGKARQTKNTREKPKLKRASFEHQQMLREAENVVFESSGGKQRGIGENQESKENKAEKPGFIKHPKSKDSLHNVRDETAAAADKIKNTSAAVYGSVKEAAEEIVQNDEKEDLKTGEVLSAALGVEYGLASQKAKLAARLIGQEMKLIRNAGVKTDGVRKEYHIKDAGIEERGSSLPGAAWEEKLGGIDTETAVYDADIVPGIEGTGKIPGTEADNIYAKAEGLGLAFRLSKEKEDTGKIPIAEADNIYAKAERLGLAFGLSREEGGSHSIHVENDPGALAKQHTVRNQIKQDDYENIPFYGNDVQEISAVKKSAAKYGIGETHKPTCIPNIVEADIENLKKEYAVLPSGQEKESYMTLDTAELQKKYNITMDTDKVNTVTSETAADSIKEMNGLQDSSTEVYGSETLDVFDSLTEKNSVLNCPENLNSDDIAAFDTSGIQPSRKEKPQRKKKLKTEKKKNRRGMLSREKLIQQEKMQFMIKNLTEPENDSMETGMGKAAKDLTIKRAAGVAAGLLKKPAAIAAKKAAFLFLPAALSFIVLIAAGMAMMMPSIVMGMFAEVSAIASGDQQYMGDSRYVYNRAKHLYEDFNARIDAYEQDPNNIVSFHGVNSCIYDTVWTYLTMLANDGYSDEDVLIIDKPQEESSLSQAFNSLYWCTVTTVHGSEYDYLRVDVYEYSYEQWYQAAISSNGLNEDAQTEHEIINEILSDSDYAYMRNNLGNINFSYDGDIIQTIWNICKDNGFTDAGAAGLLGNLLNESLSNPTLYINIPTKPLGIAQWLDPNYPQPGRRTALLNYAAGMGLPAESYEAQVQYMFYELSSGYSHVAAALCDPVKRNDWLYCCDYVCDYYEICPGQTPNSAVSTITGRVMQGLATRRTSAQTIYNNAAYYNEVYLNGMGSDTSAADPNGVTGSDVINFAKQFIGNPYVWGGTSLTNGADCSGFVMSVYAHFGYSLPHSSAAMANCGTAVSFSEAQPGDLICYSGHVALYMGGGMILGAQSAKTGITTQTAAYRPIIAVRRIIH